MNTCAIWITSLLKRLQALSFIKEETGTYKWYPLDNFEACDTFPVYIVLVNDGYILKFNNQHDFEVVEKNEAYDILCKIIITYSKGVKKHERLEVINFFYKRFPGLLSYQNTINKHYKEVASL